MKVIIRTSTGNKYQIECDDIVEREHENTTWLALKKDNSDVIRYQLCYVESIQFLRK